VSEKRVGKYIQMLVNPALPKKEKKDCKGKEICRDLRWNGMDSVRIMYNGGKVVEGN